MLLRLLTLLMLKRRRRCCSDAAADAAAALTATWSQSLEMRQLLPPRSHYQDGASENRRVEVGEGIERVESRVR